MTLPELLVVAAANPRLRAVTFDNTAASGNVVLSAVFFPDRSTAVLSDDGSASDLPSQACRCEHDLLSEHHPQTGACFFGCTNCGQPNVAPEKSPAA